MTAALHTPPGLSNRTDKARLLAVLGISEIEYIARYTSVIHTDWVDKVERWPLTKLIPYARNARTHSDEQVAQIAASIREFGFTNPVLVDEEGTPELLRLELGELKLGGFDLSLTGFGDLELAGIMADRTAGLTDPDDAPAVPEHPVSRTGDLWLLGRHRLLCGDSFNSPSSSRSSSGSHPEPVIAS